MITLSPQRLRDRRLRYVVVAAAAYALLCWAAMSLGYVQSSRGGMFLITAGWVLGFVGFTGVQSALVHSLRGQELLAFTKGLWFNLGAILIVLSIDPPWRQLLMVMPLFGLAYAALNLTFRHVVLLALCTIAVFLVGLSVVAPDGAPGDGVHGVTLVTFSGMVLGMLIVTREITALRSAYLDRHDALSGVVAKLEQLAIRDDLTGVFNRRHILDSLKRQKALADRGQIDFAICYCDLDRFKAINDQLGHGFGDAVLREFVQVAQSVMRKGDVLGRFGGEEFILMLVGADHDEAVAVAERLRSRTRQVMTPGVGDHRLTVSIGVAAYHNEENVEDLLRRADTALYEAKRAGRNSVSLSESGQHAQVSA